MSVQHSEFRIECAWCRRVLNDGPADASPGQVSHTVCHACLKQHFPEIAEELARRDACTQRASAWNAGPGTSTPQALETAAH